MAEVRLQTYWSDCDPAGIAYFGNFFRLCEAAEEGLYLQAGTPRQALLDAHGIWMPRAEAHVNFISPIRNGHAIRVRMDPHFESPQRVRLDFTMFDDETGAKLANGYMTAACVDRANFQATPIPEPIRRALRGGIQQG